MITNRRKVNAIMKYYNEQLAEDRPWAKTRRRIQEREANAFFIGVLLDYMIPYQRAWDGGKHFVKTHFPVENFWYEISQTHLNTLKSIAQRGYEGKSYHRFHEKFAINLKAASRLISKKYHGDVRNVWKDIKPESVEMIYERFKEFKGIGDALAKMAQNILVKYDGVCGGESNKGNLHVKPDIHVRRVTKRLGMAPTYRESDVVGTLESLNLDSPVDFDQAVWQVGLNFCKRNNPKCEECPLESVCEKVL